MSNKTQGRRSRIVVVNDFSQARGGATGLALRSASLLAQRGYEVVLLCGDEGRNEALEQEGVRIFGAGGVHLLHSRTRTALVDGLYHVKAARFVRQWIQTHGRSNDVYHLHGWSKILSPAIFHALKPVESRLVLHAHDFFLACPNGAFWDYQTEEVCSLVPLSSACLQRNCDRRSYAQKLWRVARAGLREQLLASSRTSPEILLIHPKMEHFFLRSGVPQSRLTVLRNPASPFCDKPVSAAQNKKFVFFGRLDAEKGPLELAKAARQAGVPLMVVGEGPLEGAIRSAYPGAELVGWKERAELPDFAAQARVLVMPSKYPEPFGLVAVEALGAGIPVVAADSAFLADEIVAAGAGRAVSVADQDGFASILRELAADDVELARMSERALEIAPRMAKDDESWCDGLVEAYGRVSSSSDFMISVPGALAV